MDRKRRNRSAWCSVDRLVGPVFQHHKGRKYRWPRPRYSHKHRMQTSTRHAFVARDSPEGYAVCKRRSRIAIPTRTSTRLITQRSSHSGLPLHTTISSKDSGIRKQIGCSWRRRPPGEPIRGTLWVVRRRSSTDIRGDGGVSIARCGTGAAGDRCNQYWGASYWNGKVGPGVGELSYPVLRFSFAIEV